MLPKTHCRPYLQLVETSPALLRLRHLQPLTWVVMVASKLVDTEVSKACQGRARCHQLLDPNNIGEDPKVTLHRVVSRGMLGNILDQGRATRHLGSKDKVGKPQEAIHHLEHLRGMVDHHLDNQTMVALPLLDSNLAMGRHLLVSKDMGRLHQANNLPGAATGRLVASSLGTAHLRPAGLRPSRAGTLHLALVDLGLRAATPTPLATVLPATARGLVLAPSPAHSPAPSLDPEAATAGLDRHLVTPARAGRATGELLASTPTAARPALAAGLHRPRRRPPTPGLAAGPRPAKTTRLATSRVTSQDTNQGTSLGTSLDTSRDTSPGISRDINPATSPAINPAINPATNLATNLAINQDTNLAINRDTSPATPRVLGTRRRRHSSSRPSKARVRDRASRRPARPPARPPPAPSPRPLRRRPAAPHPPPAAPRGPGSPLPTAPPPPRRTHRPPRPAPATPTPSTPSTTGTRLTRSTASTRSTLSTRTPATRGTRRPPAPARATASTLALRLHKCPLPGPRGLRLLKAPLGRMIRAASLAINLPLSKVRQRR